MKIIDIKVIDATKKTIKKIPYVVGEIKIDDFYETFDIPLNWWPLTMYEKQWHEGLKRIETKNVSCLITKIYDLHKAPFIDWWLYYIKKIILFIYAMKSYLGNIMNSV